MNTLQLILKIYSIFILVFCQILNIYRIISDDDKMKRLAAFIAILINIPILIYLIKY